VRQNMMKDRFHIAVAILVASFFLTVTSAHACIGAVTSGGGHEHGGMHSTGPLQTPPAGAQDEICRSLRDRLIAVAPQASQSHLILTDLNAVLVIGIGEQLAWEVQTLGAERPPGTGCVADDQPPLYIFNSVFRI
jgi:hypothetical protein